MLRRRRVTMGISALMLVAGIVIVVLALAGLGSKQKSRTIPGPEAQQDFVAVQPTSIPQPTASPEPTPEPSSAPIERFLIPKIKVDAPMVILGVDSEGVMQDPKGPEEVAWYNFSAQPGWGGNAVFAGHVDYRNYGAAVFWDLRKLVLGDEIKLRLTDGTSYTYKVTSTVEYKADEAPVQEIVGPTEKESVTIITCIGTFNSSTREYDKRLVVRAERAPDASAVAQ